jgi:methionyl-tRNA formyltransferase
VRIVFFGTPSLAVPTLAALSESHTIAAVITQPDRPRGRSSKPEPSEVKQWAVAHGLTVDQPQRIHDGSFEASLKALEPDLCVVAAYGRLLRQAVLDVPPLGWLNMHPSLLPRWRGPSPIQSALLYGDVVTGVTIMRMVLEMDAGNIVLQEETPIGAEETAGELTDRLAVLGADAMVRAVDLIASGTAPDIVQDVSRVTTTTLFEKKYGNMVWAASASALHNQVRACNPWPMAQCRFRGQLCRILRTRLISDSEEKDAAPGTVLEVHKDHVVLATGKGKLALLQLQMAGKKPLDAADFLRGAHLTVGERFEDVH